LVDLVEKLGPASSAATVEEASAKADMLLLAVPLHTYEQLPASALDGRIVIDAGNYYTDWSGHIKELDDETTTTSERLQDLFPGARVVKAFNNIYAEDVVVDARPAGSERRALPVASDDDEAKQKVTELIRSIGYDVVDAGPLSEGWRFQRATPAFVVPLNSAQLVKALGQAKRYRDMGEDVPTKRSHRMPNSES
jgi:predicted dinucleotide-binding enzyme